MDPLEILSKSALVLSNDYLLMLIAILFFVFSKKQNYSHLIFLLLFSMIYKTILKDVFKCPSPITSPTSNFAFPSGHMNFATMFYLWIMITYRFKTLYVLCPMVLILTGWSIVHVGYHYPLDMILTPIFPIFILITYRLFLIRLPHRTFGLLFVFLALISQLLSLALVGTLKCDIIIGSYGILGFVLGTAIKFKNYQDLVIPTIALVVFCLISNDFNIFIGNCLWLVIFGITSMLGKYNCEIDK